MHRYALALSLTLAASATVAQTPGDCDIGRATGTLDVSDVAATVFTTGTLAYGPGGEHEYYVPQVTGTSPLYAASVWIGGTVGGEVRVAGATYGQGGTNNDYYEFWPGPLTDDGALPNPTDCSAYDRVWVVSVLDVAAYEAGDAPTDDLAAWPVGLGALAVDADGEPVEPSSRDQVIDLAAGEQPVIYGSQTAFWVMNDMGGEHQTTESEPLGIEVAVTAFSVASDTAALNRATFYRYAITNRNALPIEDARVSLWADPDLGNAADDFVGVDTTRSLAFTYNADELDDWNYGGNPPAFGIDVLGGLADDEDQRDLTSFIYFISGSNNLGDPGDAQEYANIMRGIWTNGTPMTAFGNGYSQGGDVTTFAFPGDPVTREFWSEENNGAGRNVPGDRRFVLSTGPGTLAPGETRTVDFGLLFALGADRFDSITRLREVSDLVQGLYDDGSLFSSTPIPDGPPLATPALVSPADGGGPFENTGVTLAWTSVPDAAEYEVQLSDSLSFADPESFLTVDTTYAWPPRGPTRDVYWRVRARTGLRLSPFSEVRSFEYIYIAPPDPFAIVEVVGPGGTDPCAEAAESRNGCPEPGQPFSERAPGNGVFQSHNSTGDYVMSFKGPQNSFATIGAYAPNDFEIRWTSFEDGSYGFYTFSTGNITRVPFQIWDIGVVAPGEENDPSDDVQMVPILFTDGGPECPFGFNQQSIFGIGNTTARIYAYYPTDNDYAAWEAYAATTTCDESAPPSNEEFGVRDGFIDFMRGRPLQRDVFEDGTGERGADPVADFASLEGTVVRYYTIEFETAEDGPPAPRAVALGVPFPNPTRRRAAIPFEVAVPGPVRLAVVDVLGREVAVLVDEVRPAGPQEARLDASALAAGVYVVALETAEGGASRTITVVR